VATRRAHTPEIAGSNPALATMRPPSMLTRITDALDVLRGRRQIRDQGSYWQNYVTGLGSASFDPGAWMEPGTITPLAAETLANLALGDPIAAVIVGAPIDDGMCGGFVPRYDGEATGDADLVEPVADRLEELGAETAVRRAAKSGRGTGFGGILLDTPAAGAQPMGKDPGEIRSLVVVDTRDLVILAREGGEPSRFQIYQTDATAGSSITGTVDASWIIGFGGLDTPLRDRIRYFSGWDESVLQLVWETIRDYRSAWSSAVAMMGNASQTILKIPRLWEVYESHATAFLRRLHEIATQRSVNRIMPLDAGGAGDPSEEFLEVARTFAGIPDLLLEQKTLVAQAAGMPITRLFGISPAGLNATGEADERSWMRTYTSHRRMRIEPQLLHLVRLVAVQLGARDLAGWGVEWRAVEILSTRDQADIEEIHARTDEIRVRLGMAESTILRHRYEGEYRASAPVLEPEDIVELEEEPPAAPAVPEPAK